jgi:hypothetical protein
MKSRLNRYALKPKATKMQLYLGKNKLNKPLQLKKYLTNNNS